MAIKLSPDEISVIRAHKKELQTGDLAWIQTDKEHALDENQKGSVRAFMYEKGVNIFKKMTSVPTRFFGNVSLDTVIIPDTILELSESAFEGSNIKSIVLEEGVETIGVNAFANSNISDIELPDTIKTIKSGAFSNCKNLREIFIPDSVTEIRANMFEGDDINIWANPRKGSSRLKCPQADIDWFKEHLFKYKG